jgi:predicted GH43/DUF377 family glycosyl hydrolase
MLTVTVERLGTILKPDGSAHEAAGILNPGVVRNAAGTLMLYPRMVARGNISRIGLVRADESESKPTVYERYGPVLEPTEPDEIRADATYGYGCEDPRVTYVPLLNRYVMMYTAFGPDGPRVAVATSWEGLRWTRHGLMEYADDSVHEAPNKDAAFFPEPVTSPGGVRCFAFYHRPMLVESVYGQAPIPLLESLPPEQREVMCIGYIPVEDVVNDIDAIVDSTESVRVLPIGETWGLLKNGCGTPPVRTPHGWFSVFHAADAREGALCYQAGIVLHDLERPHKVLWRSASPVLSPETADERNGEVNDVVFPTGIDVAADGVYDIYYGAADTRIALARLTVSAQN